MSIKKINKKKTFDFIIVGTSPLAILQASYYTFRKKKILVIDKNNFIGGAWASIKIFGYTNVENAIHYFLPSNSALKFLKDYLHLKIIVSKKKIRVLKKSFFGKRYFHYDSIIGKFLTQVQASAQELIMSFYYYLQLQQQLLYRKSSLHD